ncbi:MAG TPA: hypothetical protein VNQ57_04685 [Ureibacillus sp.]|nr:hypothetical protein [Ureibacillus sp.]
MKLVSSRFFVIVLVILISIVMSLWQVNFSMVLLTNFIVAFTGLMLPTVYITLREKDISRIEKFLMKQKRNPNFMLVHALANKNDKDVEEAIHKLLRKHRQRHKQALYKTLYALYKEEILTAKQGIEWIRPLPYKHYYKSIVFIEEGNIKKATQLIEQISIPWMKSALLSEIERKKGNSEEALQLAKRALNQVNGLQKYVLYKTYQREFPQMFSL